MRYLGVPTTTLVARAADRHHAQVVVRYWVRGWDDQPTWQAEAWRNGRVVLTGVEWPTQRGAVISLLERQTPVVLAAPGSGQLVPWTPRRAPRTAPPTPIPPTFRGRRGPRVLPGA